MCSSLLFLTAKDRSRGLQQEDEGWDTAIASPATGRASSGAMAPTTNTVALAAYAPIAKAPVKSKMRPIQGTRTALLATERELCGVMGRTTNIEVLGASAPTAAVLGRSRPDPGNGRESPMLSR